MNTAIKEPVFCSSLRNCFSHETVFLTGSRSQAGPTNMVLCVLAVEEQWTEGIALADRGRKGNMLNREFAVVCRNLLSPRYSEDAVGWFGFCVVFFPLY